MKLKSLYGLILSFTVAFLSVFNAYASVSTPSEVISSKFNIATSSDALLSQDFMDLDNSDLLETPVLLSAGDDIYNTVNLTECAMSVRYYDMSGVTRDISARLNSSGYASIASPSDVASLLYLDLHLYRGALPSSAGKYKMEIYFGSNTGLSYSNSRLYAYRGVANTQTENVNSLVNTNYSSGDLYASMVVDFGSTDRMLLRTTFSGKSNSFPVGGYWKVRFSKTTASADISGPNAGGDVTNQQIVDNTAQQVAQGDTIIELIKNTIQTISSQLTAFWNQLAGEFTNLFNKMNQQHSEQLQADRENTDDIIAAEESNTTNIINNNNANTDKITNGYDNSGMLSENDRLNNSLNEYQKQEDEVFNQAKDKVNSFEYGNHFDKFTAPLADISFFLTGIYDGLGSLNVPIAFALTLSVSLLAIGYYRFKSGS